MELNLKKIQQLDVQQILQILLPTIDKFYKTIDFIDITKDQLYKLVLDEIGKSKKTYKGDVVYVEYIKNRIK